MRLLSFWTHPPGVVLLLLVLISLGSVLTSISKASPGEIDSLCSSSRLACHILPYHRCNHSPMLSWCKLESIEISVSSALERNNASLLNPGESENHNQLHQLLTAMLTLNSASRCGCSSHSPLPYRRGLRERAGRPSKPRVPSTPSVRNTNLRGSHR